MLNGDLRDRLAGAELLLFDGTLWRDNEMVQAGLSHKTGKRMGHMSMSGPDGSIAAFADLGITRRIFIHMNNTNPCYARTLKKRPRPKPQAGRSGGMEWRSSYDAKPR